MALSSSEASADPTMSECLAANERAIALRADRKLRQALDQTLACAARSCPQEVRETCERRVAELNAAIPTIAFLVKDAAGHDVVDVKVQVDGTPLVDHLDGIAVAVETGLHVFRFEVAGEPPLTQSFLLREGEKDRHETVVIGAAAPAPTTAAVPTPSPKVAPASIDAPPAAAKPALGPYSLEFDFSLLGLVGVEAASRPGAIFGGDIVDACTSAPCSTSTTVGGHLVARGGYELKSGFGVSADLGYLILYEAVKERAATLTSGTGKVDTGLATDDLALNGVTLGASGFFRVGDDWPFTLRLGVGLLLGSTDDGRSGTFATDADPSKSIKSASYDVSARETPLAIYFMTTPEVRLGRRVGDRFAVSLGVQAPMLFALVQPKWTNQTGILMAPAGKTGDGVGGFGAQTVSGVVIVTIAPTVGLHYAF